MKFKALGGTEGLEWLSVLGSVYRNLLVKFLNELDENNRNFCLKFLENECTKAGLCEKRKMKYIGSISESDVGSQKAGQNRSLTSHLLSANVGIPNSVRSE